MRKSDVVKLIKFLNNNIRKKNKKKIELHEPSFFGNEIFFLNRCIKEKQVSTYGKYTGYFEKEIKRITKAKYSVALTSGTEALHLSLRAIGITSDHEILVPAMTFIASVNAISYCGAEPHFIDTDINTLEIDYKKLDQYLESITIKKKGKTFNKFSKKHIKALMPVHIFGHSSNILKIKKIAKKYNLVVIEDAAEAFGSFVKKQHLGTFGEIGCLSFNGNKIVTTGGGGAIITNNKILAQKVFQLSTVYKTKNSFGTTHNGIGYNSRMPSINASLGLAQIKNFQKIKNEKKKLYFDYDKIISNFEGIKLFKENKDTDSNYWLHVLILDEKNRKFKKAIIQEGKRKNFYLGSIWKLVSNMKPYINKQKMDLSGSKNIHDRVICLPSGAGVLF